MKTCKLDAGRVSALILEELALHPMLEPVDLYKLLYQAMFGPSHIVRDLGQLSKSISSELWQMKRAYMPLFQDIGDTYTRISLSAIKESKELSHRQQKIDCLSTWILASCSEYANEQQDFLLCWNEHLPLLQKLLKSASSAWEHASALAADGHLPSHSSPFHTHYDPHYRLVRMDRTEHYKLFMELNK